MRVDTTLMDALSRAWEEARESVRGLSTDELLALAADPRAESRRRGAAVEVLVEQHPDDPRLWRLLINTAADRESPIHYEAFSALRSAPRVFLDDALCVILEGAEKEPRLAGDTLHGLYQRLREQPSLGNERLAALTATWLFLNPNQGYAAIEASHLLEAALPYLQGRGALAVSVLQEGALNHVKKASLFLAPLGAMGCSAPVTWLLEQTRHRRTPVRAGAFYALLRASQECPQLWPKIAPTAALQGLFDRSPDVRRQVGVGMWDLPYPEDLHPQILAAFRKAKPARRDAALGVLARRGWDKDTAEAFCLALNDDSATAASEAVSNLWDSWKDIPEPCRRALRACLQKAEQAQKARGNSAAAWRIARLSEHVLADG